MEKNSFTAKVRAVRDTIIDCIQDLSSDKQNLLPNIKVIKELTSVLKEMDRIDERDDKQTENSKEEIYDFYNKIRDKVSIPYNVNLKLEEEVENE